MKKLLFVLSGLLSLTATPAQELHLNQLDYFELQEVGTYAILRIWKS